MIDNSGNVCAVNINSEGKSQHLVSLCCPNANLQNDSREPSLFIICLGRLSQAFPSWPDLPLTPSRSTNLHSAGPRFSECGPGSL